MDHAADTMPQRTVSEGIDVHPDKESPAYQVSLRHEAPIAAVVAVVPVVAHGEILAFRHCPFALMAESARHVEDLVARAAQVLAHQRRTLRLDIRSGVGTQDLFGHQYPIDIQRFIAVDNTVARQAHDALDVVLASVAW